MFANEHIIDYFPKTLELDQPIITIVQSKEKWVSAEIHPDRIVLIKFSNCNRAVGSDMAETIASTRGVLYMPELGTLLNQPLQ